MRAEDQIENQGGEEEAVEVYPLLQQSECKRDRWDSKLDLNRFKNISQRKPDHWSCCVGQASEIHIDDMRTLLELHYDEIHTASWLRNHEGMGRKVPARQGAFAVYSKVADVRRSRLTQQLELPSAVKKILRYRAEQINFVSIDTSQVEYSSTQFCDSKTRIEI